MRTPKAAKLALTRATSWQAHTRAKKSVAALFLKALLLLLKYTSAAANGAKYNHAAGECRGLWFARRFGDKQSA